MPLLVSIWIRMRGQFVIESAYSLGKFGLVFNIVGTLYLVFAIITFNFPSVAPLVASNMNYTSAAVGVSIVIATTTWFTTGRKQYTGPQRGSIVRSIEDVNYTPRSVEDLEVTSKVE